MKKNRTIPLFNWNKEKRKMFFMRLGLFKLMLIFGLMSTHANVNSQMIISKLKLEKVELSSALERVEELSSYDFVFNYNDLKGYKVSVDLENTSLENCLDELLKNVPFEYETKGDVVIVKYKKKAEPIQEQEKRELKGTVTDVEGNTLPGVSVFIKGTTIGAITDLDGRYNLIIKDNKKHTIVFSFVGMTTKEVELIDQQVVDVVLSQACEELGEVNVVVSTGYQKIDRRLFTGSASKVKAEDIKREGELDVSRMLEGQVAGVSVQNVSGTFGAAPKVHIRGASSIYGDQKPLWVVDDVVLEDVVNISADQLSSGDAATLISSSVAGLNADDIQDIQVLKDASATALYGARAMNGVIVITTKTGVKGKPKISYTGNFSMRLKPSYQEYDIMNSQDQMSIYREMERKGWLNHADVSRAENGGVYAKMYDQINTYDEKSGRFLLENTEVARANFLRKYELANTDWFDILFDNSLTQEHSVSVSSGSDYTSTYFSVSYYNDNGWAKGSGVDRYTANLRMNFDLSDKLSVGFSTIGSIREQEAPGTINRASSSVDGKYDRDFDINPFSYALNTSRTLKAYDENGNLEYFRRNHSPFNIINELNNNQIDLSVLDLKIQGSLRYKILNDLEYNFIGAIRYVKSTREHLVNENSNYASAYRAAASSTIRKANKLLYKNLDDPNAEPEVVLPKGGFYNRHENLLKNFYFRNTINWNKTLESTHLLNVLAGQEVRCADRQYFFSDGPGYQYNRGGVPFIDYRYYKQNLEFGSSPYGMGWEYDRFIAFFVNGSYSYKGKYTFNGTARMDGSNQLGKKKSARWLPTWNVSGSWNVHTEDFLSNSETISRLVLRGTYGLTASMGAAKNSTIILMNSITERPYLSEKESSIGISELENADLTWEKQYEANIGIDLGLYHGRINLALDAYKRFGFDLIGVFRTSGMGGQSYKLANYADMETNGVEMSLSTVNIKSNDFSWNTTFNFAYNENEITRMQSRSRVYSLVKAEGGAFEGYPVRGLYSIPFAGLNEFGKPLFYNSKGEKTEAIQMQSNKVDYLKYEGPIDPKVTGGLSNYLNYKNWSLSALVTYQWGSRIRLNPVYRSSYSDLDAMPNDYKNRWILPGDEESTTIPVTLTPYQEKDLNGYDPYNTYNFSTERVAKGDFIRLKNVSLSYKFSNKLLRDIKLSGMEMSLQASNLWLIYSDSKLNGQDPEFFGAGGVAMPTPKQFTFSLKLSI